MNNTTSFSKKIIPRAEHNISRKNISLNALKVLHRLASSGFEAYLVGGSVRDLLLENTPKDFDIATDAKPEEIRKLFTNCRLIGRRFRLAHVYFGRDIIEVATFRSSSNCHLEQKTGMLICDNNYGAIEEDAIRRDFTINSLYYNIKDFSVIEFTQGLEDLKHKTIRIIGDPMERYREDPVRMLRAIRLAGKLGFGIETATLEAIQQLKQLLVHVPPARLAEETSKWFMSGNSIAIYELMHQNDLFAILFPHVADALNNSSATMHNFLQAAFVSTDTRIKEQKPINPAFMFAVLLWIPLQRKVQDYVQHECFSLPKALHVAIPVVIRQQALRTTLPNYWKQTMKEIWLLQYRLTAANDRKLNMLAKLRRFKAAYDFMLLRAQADEDLQAVIQKVARKIPD